MEIKIRSRSTPSVSFSAPVSKEALLFALTLGSLLNSPLVLAWDQHRYLMPFIFNSSNSNDPKLRLTLEKVSTAPCAEDDKKAEALLTEELKLNPEHHLPSTSPLKCGTGSSLSVRDILTGTGVDDPDQGMDRNLPTGPGNTFDPSQDRRWMGGTTGPNSQGFRHMYFGGWKMKSPMITLQVPLHPVGQAPQRFEMMANQAKNLIRSGNLIWGSRVLTWAAHYLQDLCQPFHVAQILDLSIVPWQRLMSWPPTEAVDPFIKETTRIVTNFHWSYEGYVLYHVKMGEKSLFADCLRKPEKVVQGNFNPKTQTPSDLVQIIVNQSLLLASDLGKAETRFFGSQLLPQGADVTQNDKLIPFDEYSQRVDLQESRTQIHVVTCKALANASWATQNLVRWAFEN